MKLDNKEFKEFKALDKKSNRTKAEEERYQELLAKKNSKSSDSHISGNDFAWWNKYPEILKDVANYKCNWLAGTPLNVKDVSVYVPGAFRFKVHNMYGFDASATDPFNMEIRKLYLRMFNKYRGISSYTVADLGITLISTVEVFILAVKLARIYGVIKTYDMLNHNLPDTICSALGLSSNQADYIRSHLSDYRSNLNVLIQKAQSICMPADMSILKDKLSLFGNVYLDHNGKRAQAIIFDCYEYGIFYPVALQSGGCVKFETKSMNEVIDFTYNTGTSSSGTTMFPVLDKMLNSLLENEIVNKQFGDLSAVFGLDQLVTISPIAEDYTVVPVYSESILHKMHNLDTLCTSGFQATGPNSTHGLRTAYPAGMSSQDRLELSNTTYRYAIQFNNVVYTVCSIVNYGDDVASQTIDGMVYIDSDHVGTVYRTSNPVSILDSYHTEFTPEIVTEGVLWKFTPVRLAGASMGEVSTVIKVQSCGPEIIDEITCHTKKGATVISDVLVGNRVDTTISGYEEDLFNFLSKISYLDWAPMLVGYDANEYESMPSKIYGDIDNAKPMYTVDLLNLHRAIVQSAFRTDIHTK